VNEDAEDAQEALDRLRDVFDQSKEHSAAIIEKVRSL
jgi:hypothetical protein